MHSIITRRGFLAGSAAFTVAAALPPVTHAASQRKLVATTRTLDIKGKPATVFGIANQQGGQGLVLEPGERFSLTLENKLAEETLIHWHGQIPPNRQDGVPDMPMPKLKPGESRDYDFTPLAGTHWMHAHIPAQEMQLLAAPLIVRSEEDKKADRQEAVLFLHDFTFTPLAELLDRLGAGGAGHGSGMGMMPGMGGMNGMGGMGGMNHGAMQMDLNDVEFDAYLANDRTLADPEVVTVERGGEVLLRIVNASSATVYWIDSGALDAELVAVDGHPVAPLKGRRFGLAMAQRLDIVLRLPSAGGAFPILALREGARERTGLVLATPGAEVKRIGEMGEDEAPAFGLEQEARLSALAPLPSRPAVNGRMVMLGGGMEPYLWTIDGRTWGEHAPIAARSGERFEIALHNMSMMAHPMHLHGHSFQVVAINGRRFSGAIRDTVHVPPMAMITIAVDAGEAARWMFHCHHMLHLETGMMTEFSVAA
ncbi:multicopper oxidase family protein [Nitratireductor sp. ZSWI3]|uniref:multicopper oxidase family protein n=1 Tax=Nitratireductor sp. ZSWI3 TaxID=2966359 RepID=UPI00215041FA|nr:multicopper oxidase family protein [Nitratireductor sp. ZSWI3]MCR4265708.1 multicopper oxidase family protein [Nitratireductor sp. ZSWI3]